MQLRPFQGVGRDFLKANTNALLLDDAGLGKTAEVLTAADDLGLDRVLVVGPSVAAVSWLIETKTWSPSRCFVELTSQTSLHNLMQPGVYFVSYDLLSLTTNKPLRRALTLAPPWDVLVLDEAQYLKTPGANRTRAIYGAPLASGAGIAGNTVRTWVLSGTLTPNHAGEAYTHLRTLFPHVLSALGTPNQHDFENKFCVVEDTAFGRVIRGSRNQQELRRHVTPIMLRRRKLDVLPELAPMEWFTAPLSVSPALADAKLRITEDETQPPDIRDLARQQLGLLKAPACVAWIEERLNAGEPKILVFAHHRTVLNQMMDGLADHSPVLIHGDTPTPDRRDAVLKFQTDPTCRILVGQLQAAGTAITLTAASTVFFVEYASTPGVNFQAASRAHRFGQSARVQVYFGSVPGSLDIQIARTAARRAREIAQLFD